MSEYLLINLPRLEDLKIRLQQDRKLLENERELLVDAASAALEAPQYSVMNNKYTPPSGDKHDYASLAKYWWPNPDSPNGLPYVQRDGITNPEVNQYDVAALEGMTKAVRDLSFAYYYSGSDAFAKHAAQLLDTWFINPETKMNPNFSFAQFRPGHDEITGNGIIESHRFRWLLDNSTMLLESHHWSDGQQEQLKKWFADYLDWLISSRQGKNIRSNPDNKGTWYIAQALSYALFTGEVKLAHDLITEAKDRIDKAINKDGLITTETHRTRSLHYHMFHLQAFFDIAILARHLKVNLFAYQGAGGSLKQALDFMLPYVTGPAKHWPFTQIDKVRYPIVSELLRRAAVYYADSRYEGLLKSVPVASEGDATVLGYLSLVEPPVESGL